VSSVRTRAARTGGALAAFVLAFSTAFAADAPAPLTLDLIVPPVVAADVPRDIAVRLTNKSTAPLLVLPNMLRLRIEGRRAEYVPHPGPPVDPWGGARELAPGAAMRVDFPDTSDKRGVWRLPPGNYRVRAVYEVPRDLKPPASVAGPAQVWRGRLESAPALMTIQ